MADVAAIFHWQPAAFADCDLEQLMDWRHRAIERGKLLGLVGDGS